MNKFILAFLLIYSFNLNSQIVEVWKEHRPYGVYFDYSEMKIVGSNIFIHSVTELANSHQYAQSITTNGEENWFTTHDQLNECFECGFASVEEAAINSSGEAFAVGQQNAFPYSGRYYSKTSATGEIDFANEFLTNPWASGFEGVSLSADESYLFASGYQFTQENDGLGSHLYKLGLDGQIIQAQFLGNQFASINKFVVNSSDQIFCNISDTDTLKYARFDSDLQINWTRNIPVPGYTSTSGYIKPLLFSNGDVLFVDYMYLIDNNSITKLHLTRISPSGEIIWETIRDMANADQFSFFYKDFKIDAFDNVFCYFVRRFIIGGGGGIAAEEQTTLSRGGKGGETQIRPALLKFNDQGEYQWTYIEPGNTDIEFSTVYPGHVITDEEGYSIISCNESAFETGGVTYTVLRPSGVVETSIYVDDLNEGSCNEMVYGGNRTFYSHTLGLNPENLNESHWVVARYQYDITTNVSSLDSAPSFSLFPNPASEFVIIEAEQKTNQKYYSLSDLSGRLISVTPISQSGQTKISIEGISPGIYFISNGLNTIHLIAQ
ncbi:MAG: T9SS type A sorting domain-containing protein [Bacteroidia bacterium]